MRWATRPGNVEAHVLLDAVTFAMHNGDWAAMPNPGTSRMDTSRGSVKTWIFFTMWYREALMMVDEDEETTGKTANRTLTILSPFLKRNET